jgi:hypothetical protein
MTPDELATRIGSITDKATANLSKTITASQKALYSDMEALLSKLELDSEGMIKQSQANRKLLLRVDGVFNSSLSQSGYYDGLEKFTSSYATLTAANEKYFNFILDTFTVDSQYIKSLQKSSILEIETLLANDGLEAALKAPLNQILNTNINTGASLSDMLTQVRQFITGSPDAEGKLLRYSKQITRDSLFNYSSSLQESVSQKAKLSYYYYQGHRNSDSRDFCITRKGRYFHKKEVESWGSMSWQGQRAGTNSSTIFIYRGGWNCEDSLIPVSELVVPDDVKQRVKDNGFT